MKRERLIESHLPLAKSVAKRYAGRGVDLDDLVQVGAVGLIKAADRFDATRGVAFSTFAEPTIEGEIRHHLRDRSAPVRVPRELQRLGKRLRGRQGELTAQLGRDPTLSELADALEADVGEVQRALAAEHVREAAPLPPPDAAAAAEEPIADSEARLVLAERMHVLDERERRIVYLRFHADLTEREIARELEISQAHVSRLLAGALAKLQTELADEQAARYTGDITSVSREIRVTAAVRGGGPEASRDDPEGPSKPRPPGTYSGRFLVRMSSDLHGQLVQAAARENLSLNRYVMGVLAESVAGDPDTGESANAASRGDTTEPGHRPGEAGGGAAASREPADPRPRDPRRSLRLALAANVVVVILAATVAVVLLVLAFQHGL
ncbi:MAG: sigma-70 family RNA polymerase sigma factor [Solirubrobacteraceae bacterium]